MPEGLERREITFEQAEGAAELPSQLELRQISSEMEALLWAAIYDSINREIVSDLAGYGGLRLGGRWRNILYAWHVTREHRMADEFSSDPSEHIEKVKAIIQSGDYIRVLGFVEFVVRNSECPQNLLGSLARILEFCRSAYRIIDKSIVPAATEAEATAAKRAFADLAGSEYHGARTHLRKAAVALTAGHFADSVRESIHSVEAVCRTIDPTASTLGAALVKLEKSGTINPNLKRGINALYDYTSDEDGIRHALIAKDAPDVDEADALYMFGACASFVTYLITKTRA